MLFLYYFILFYCFSHRKTIRNWRKIHCSIWVYSLCNKAHVVKTFTAHVLILHEKTRAPLDQSDTRLLFFARGRGDQKALSYSTNPPPPLAVNWQSNFILPLRTLHGDAWSPFHTPWKPCDSPSPPKKTKQNKTKQKQIKGKILRSSPRR